MLCCLVPLLASAEIYKSTDADGNVVFSDIPNPGAKKITLPPPTTYTPAPLPTSGTTASKPVAAEYTGLRIIKPSAGETIRDNTGAVSIEIEVIPSLNVQAGHKLVVELDGKNLSSNENATQISVSNMERGAHTVKALIMNAAGQVQTSSESTTFYMKRESALQRQKNVVPTPTPKPTPKPVPTPVTQPN